MADCMPVLLGKRRELRKYVKFPAIHEWTLPEEIDISIGAMYIEGLFT